VLTITYTAFTIEFADIIIFIDLIITFFLIPFYLYLALICGAAFLRSQPLNSKVDRVNRFVFLIPAHDEQDIIQATVKSCLKVEYESYLFKVFVIADNCSDDTALVARSAGAEVFERSDDARRSKGHAIECFFSVSS